MSSEGSVTCWLTQLQTGDPEAAQALWERYYRRMLGLARVKLQGTRRAAADEEDVALSAFETFCRGCEAGRFPQLADRDDLWRLLMTLTARKAVRTLRQERRQKRGGGAVLDEAALADMPTEQELDQVLGREPTPEFAAQVADECRRLLQLLGDAELERIALLKMEGYTNEEIAAKLDYTVRTIERKVTLIRRLWAKEVEEPM